ncbi:MAG: Fic family protein [Alphaproteobacteria bacterium]|nr:Fic family protein [Alphaproteobacteria bacterium]
MDPMLPPEGSGKLNDLAFDLVSKASKFSGKLNPTVSSSIGNLVRSMNCYYSNLIEGHDTHPIDIDRALSEDYSVEPKQRDLQKEAIAHIRVQEMIDKGMAPDVHPVSSEFGTWVHKEFCDRLPNDLLWIENPDTKEKKRVIPGRLRDGAVAVGDHIAPRHNNLGMFLNRFDEAYAPESLSRIQKIVSVAASHHRYVWIHPFYDGNGRVVRLMSYAAFLKSDIGSDLWSIARGLARNKDRYKSLLQAADGDRRGDYDGRGNLSEKALINFCEFFLSTCIDQVEYMNSILNFETLSNRMRIHIEEEIAMKKLPKGSYSLLREALLVGEFERGKAEELTGYKERAARDVLNALTKRGLLVSNTSRGPVRLGFPIEVVERWFPLLYPDSPRK